MSKKSFWFKFILVFVFICIFCCRNVIWEMGSFVTAFFCSPKSVGAILPSSPRLANEITKKINMDQSLAIKILEVGAGTGAFTEKIAEKLRDQDSFDVIEIDSDFCKILEDKFKDKKNIHINCLSVLDWQPEYKYDFIVSGLPFNSFESGFVKAVLERYKKLMKPDGILSFFEYILASDVKKLFLSGKEKEDYKQTRLAVKNFRKEYEFERDRVFINIPPAYVHHLKIRA